MIESFDRFQRICYVVIAILGVPVNLVAIATLSRGRCGLSICTTRYLVAMSTADLLAVVTAVILRRMNIYFTGSFLDIYPYCCFIFVLMAVTRDCSVWFTVTFTFDRFVVICCQKLKTKYCTGKTAVIVLATTTVLAFMKNVPLHFASEPRVVIDNVPWFCDRKPAYYTARGWVEYSRFGKAIVPLLPFAAIVLFNILTVRHIIWASRIRKALRGQSKSSNGSDPEIESRRRSVILLFIISGTFILLWLTTLVDYLYYNVAGRNPNYYNPSEYIFRQAGYILLNVSLCTNTLIYGVTQAKFRKEFINALKYPVNKIIGIINKQVNS